MNFNDYYYLSEMIIIGPKPKDQDNVIAFDKWIWILNDEMENKEQILQDIANKLKEDLGLQDDDETIDRLLRNDDVYDFITNIQEYYNDILVGQINGKNLYLYDYGSFKADPKSSILVKKVVNQLKLSSASYIEDIDSNETKVSKKKMIAKIPDIGYHGTTSNYVERIMKIGLRAGEKDSNYSKQGIYHDELVFFATRIGEAMGHASHTANEKGGIPVILEFQIPDKDLVIADYDVEKITGSDRHYTGVGNDRDDVSSYQKDPDKLSRHYGVYGYKGNIKPSFIKNIYVSSKGSEEVYSIKDFKKMKPKTFLRQLEMGYWDF